jgi:hypothetical protein
MSPLAVQPSNTTFVLDDSLYEILSWPASKDCLIEDSPSSRPAPSHSPTLPPKDEVWLHAPHDTRYSVFASIPDYGQVLERNAPAAHVHHKPRALAQVHALVP